MNEKTVQKAANLCASVCSWRPLRADPPIGWVVPFTGSRKIRCDRKDPCTSCRAAKIECVLASQKKRKNNSTLYPELLVRLKRYADALESYGADLQSIAGGRCDSSNFAVECGSESSNGNARERTEYAET